METSRKDMRSQRSDGKYNQDLRDGAVRIVSENGKFIVEVTQDLDIEVVPSGVDFP